MTGIKFLTLYFLLISITLFGQETDTIKVYYLGGQSNMDGYGYNSELPDSLNKTFENVWIFHGNSVPDNDSGGGNGKWEQLKPGHGFGFIGGINENQLSDRFGVELSFVEQLSNLYPNEQIAIIKYSRGGSSINSLASFGGCWEPDYKGVNGINQYDHFLATVRNAYCVQDIDGNGRTDYLVPQGIIWMQGESDAEYNEEVALRYYDNLKRLMDLIRAAFRDADLPVVIGRISDSYLEENGKVWDYLELIQYGQEKFVLTDRNAVIVRETRNYNYSDPYHYNSQGYIDLGKKFADSIYKFQELDN